MSRKFDKIFVIFAKIARKHDFNALTFAWFTWEVLSIGLPQDKANVNALNTLFESYIKLMIQSHDIGHAANISIAPF